ncbi:hypothetical protein B0H17DRAFT_1143973 [Mycena rosella]|uniref:Uncharacterized protein n=1 Tax=Mycena rosella TaxID=1033263 RepID=A0AAD7CTJ4_MYCRO|nr:hypothetical protein B0H17DRAFT_1143973 [Mycena rosella]
MGAQTSSKLARTKGLLPVFKPSKDIEWAFLKDALNVQELLRASANKQVGLPPCFDDPETISASKYGSLPLSHILMSRLRRNYSVCATGRWGPTNNRQWVPAFSQVPGGQKKGQ